jgi:RNA polymerase sigma factor (sigma-70 family)
MNPHLLPAARLARSVLRTQSDERLTALAQDGSDAAFETLVTRYRRSMVRHCGRVVGHSDAEEAVQNALVSAHHALTRGDSVRNVGPWLHTIAHNAALNILRTRSARPEGSRFETEELEHHDVAVERREQLRDVVDVLQSLPLRQRDAIVMRELEGLSYEEIAARLGSSSGAVRQLLNRARHAIRDRLGALAGVEPLIRWFAGGSGGAPAVARLGALAGGCAVTAKLCTAALIPAAVVIATTPHTATPHTAAPHTATHHSAPTRTTTRRSATPNHSLSATNRPAARTTRFVAAVATPRAGQAVITTTSPGPTTTTTPTTTTRAPANHARTGPATTTTPGPATTTTPGPATTTPTPATPRPAAHSAAADCPPKPQPPTSLTEGNHPRTGAIVLAYPR